MLDLGGQLVDLVDVVAEVFFCFSVKKWESIDELASLLIHYRFRHFPFLCYSFGSWSRIIESLLHLLHVCLILWSDTLVACSIPFIFRYLSELLGERQKISPFMAVLPHCYRLLNQGMIKSNSVSSFSLLV